MEQISHLLVMELNLSRRISLAGKRLVSLRGFALLTRAGRGLC